jgi:transglutaminase superfamily protein
MRPLDKAALAAEIVAAYVQARWLMRRRDLPTTLAALRPRTTGAPQAAGGVPAGQRLGRATVRTLSALPTDSRCLMRSLVLSRLLDRRGIASALVIGVKPGESFGAHAWVEIAGRPVLDPGGYAFPRLVEL